MPFNADKCKVMHVGYGNTQATYKLGSDLIKAIKEEQDLGVIMSADLKVAQQCKKAANTANKVLGMINRTIANKEAKILLPLYKSLVRPHLEYCIQVWNPYLHKDIKTLEKFRKEPLG
jgi:ribonucleases P/MRP protein subunit RPP40